MQIRILNSLEYDKIDYTRFNIKCKEKSDKYFENYHIFFKRPNH